MADTTPDRDDSTLKRRARRRLVGAVALALVAVVVLPMVLDPEPRPLGDQVEIRLPDQSEPFEASAEPAQPVPVPSPGLDGPSSTPQAPAPSVPMTRTDPVLKSDAKPAPQPEPRPETRPPEPKPAPKRTVKPEPKPAAVPVAKVPEARGASPAKPEASPGQYYLQIGVFSSETNAQLQVAKAKAAGFKAASTPSGGRHRVRVGPIDSRDQALDYQRKLKARGVDTLLIAP